MCAHQGTHTRRHTYSPYFYEDEVEDAASASKKMEEKWKMEEDDAAPTWKVEWKMESEG